ncbi:hypothetical protein IFR05_006514 [Cadophora sp. M221]|nr:hypothetical protein IFR05_006514 [Cadophora sp. M221]
MSASSKDFQSKAKKEDGSPTSSLQGSHSRGLSTFLTQFSGAYARNDASVIRGAQNSLVAILKTEKKIDKERAKVKRDKEELAESFDKTLTLKDGGKKGKKENCCGCGGCDEF